MRSCSTASLCKPCACHCQPWGLCGDQNKPSLSPRRQSTESSQMDGTDLLSGAEGRHTRTTQDMARFRNELVTRFLCRRCVNEHVHCPYGAYKTFSRQQMVERRPRTYSISSDLGIDMSLWSSWMCFRGPKNIYSRVLIENGSE